MTVRPIRSKRSEEVPSPQCGRCSNYIIQDSAEEVCKEFRRRIPDKYFLDKEDCPGREPVKSCVMCAKHIDQDGEDGRCRIYPKGVPFQCRSDASKCWHFEQRADSRNLENLIDGLMRSKGRLWTDQELAGVTGQPLPVVKSAIGRLVASRRAVQVGQTVRRAPPYEMP